MRQLSLVLVAALTLTGCGETAKHTTATATRSQAAAAASSGCADAVRIIADIRQHPESLGADDGRQASQWAGQWAAKVMPTDLGRQETFEVGELWKGLTSISIVFPEDTPRAVNENLPKINDAADKILTLCGHAK